MNEKRQIEGVKGDRIPVIARILCLADSYDAMTSNRVYRPRLSDKAVVSELKKNRGARFDPVMVGGLPGCSQSTSLPSPVRYGSRCERGYFTQ